MSGTHSQLPNTDPRQGQDSQGSPNRKPHPTLDTQADHLDILRDGLQPRPKTDPSLANHGEDVRHRLEAVVQRALSLSDSVAPAPASTTAQADGSHGTQPTTQAATSSVLAPQDAELVFSEPSPLSSASPSSQFEGEAFQPQLESAADVGIWRSEDPFKAQTPASSSSAHLTLSPSAASPHNLSEASQRNIWPPPEAAHLVSIGESSESVEHRAAQHDRASIAFEGHTNDNLLGHAHHTSSIRPFVQAIMAFEKGRKFSTGTSVHRRRKMSTLVEKEGAFGPALTVCLSQPR